MWGGGGWTPKEEIWDGKQTQKIQKLCPGWTLFTTRHMGQSEVPRAGIPPDSYQQVFLFTLIMKFCFGYQDIFCREHQSQIHILCS